MSDRNKMILSIAAVVVVLLAAFFLFVRPQQQELGQLKADVAAENQETSQLNAELERLQELERNAPELQADLNEFREAVPQQDEVASFIFQVQEAANEAGVGFVQVTPEVPKSPPEGASLAEVRTTIGASGSYFAVQDFVRRLYDLDRAVRIDNLQVQKAEEEAEGSTGETELNLTAISRVFFELPAGATGGTTTTTPAPAPAP